MSRVKITAPPLGWNSYDSYSCHIYEELCMKELEVFVKVYAPHGYEYFVIDNGWFSEQELIEADGYRLPFKQHADPEDVTIDEFGIPQPSNCFFPNGFKPLGDFCNANNVKLGLHLMRGIPRKAVELNTPIKGTNYRAADIADTSDTCCWCSYMYGVDMTKPGAQEYYNSVFEQFSEWGVQFVKVDDVTHRPAEVEGYAKAAEKCSGPILLSLSPGGTTNKKHLETYKKSHMARITKDIWDNQEAIDLSFTFWDSWQGTETEDFYPDLDMIPFGELCILKRPANFQKGNNASFAAGDTMHHICHYNEAQKESFITQRAMCASPVMIGGSMISMDEHSVKLLTSKDMLDCVKNGVVGKRVNKDNANIAIYLTPEKQLDKDGFQRYTGVAKGWIGVFNTTNKPTKISLTQNELGFKYVTDLPDTDKYALKNIWSCAPEATIIAPEGLLDIEIPANGVAFYRFKKTGRK